MEKDTRNTNETIVTYVLVEVEPSNMVGHYEKFDLIPKESFKQEEVEPGFVATYKTFRNHTDAATFERLRNDWGSLMSTDPYQDPAPEETAQEIKEVEKQMKNLVVA